MLELTNNLNYMLPIVLGLAMSKWVADFVTRDSVYRRLVDLKGVPYLDESPSEEMKLLLAKHIMHKKVKYLLELMTASQVIALLKSTEHAGFPVVDSHDQRKVKGMMLRNQILILLDLDPGEREKYNTHEAWENFLSWRIPKLESIDKKYSENLARYDEAIDFRPYMNTSVVKIDVSFRIICIVWFFFFFFFFTFALIPINLSHKTSSSISLFRMLS